jgi:hypothetical protein
MACAQRQALWFASWLHIRPGYIYRLGNDTIFAQPINVSLHAVDLLAKGFDLAAEMRELLGDAKFGSGKPEALFQPLQVNGDTNTNSRQAQTRARHKDVRL